LENINRNNMKRIFIAFLSVIAISELLWGIVISLSAPACAGAELKKAFEFVQEAEYYGMTIDECEIKLGKKVEEVGEGCFCFNVGGFNHESGGEYILVIMLDEEQRVKQVLLEEVW